MYSEASNVKNIILIWGQIFPNIVRESKILASAPSTFFALDLVDAQNIHWYIVILYLTEWTWIMKILSLDILCM